MKNIKFKSLLNCLSMAVIVLSTVSCYDDFEENEFDYTAVYLPQPSIDRTFIMGEGMRIGVGVVLGGRLENNKDVEVTFSLNDSLLGSSTKLPDSHYSLEDAEGNPANNKIIIPAGKTQGFVYVKADSLNYLNDILSLGNNYSLGFTLENVINADSILTEAGTTKFKSTLINFSYVNQLFGTYIQKGQFTKTDENNIDSITTVVYPGNVSDDIQLTMLSPSSLEYSRLVDNLRNSNNKLKINVNEDNSIDIETADGGIDITDDNGSTYNPETREIILNYSFNFNGFDYKANDTLTFRNRVIDGVNQFFDVE